MKLFEHPDFDQAIVAAREHFVRPRLTEQLIEKDYYVTEALRSAAEALPSQLIFKGGTSLSKGWGLIERFSEDIDLFVNPAAFHPSLSVRALDRQLKALRDAVSDHAALTHDPILSQTLGGGVGRTDSFAYPQRFRGLAAIAPRILLEVGTSSGTQPTEVRELSSYLSQFLRMAGLSLGAEDEMPFSMPLLHFRRTFVEKMFAIHAKVEILKSSGKPVGGYARHYYDLYCLSRRSEVLDMLRSQEYEMIKQDYEQVSLRAFPRGYYSPKAMRFANSDALFPPQELRAMIAAEYENQCQALCYGEYPNWNEVQGEFERLRPLI